jgi:hypothetical protein
MSASAGSTREEGGANGRTVATQRPGLAPKGVNNLGEALAAICSLASFPPMSGAPTYKLWEAHLHELSGYVHRYPATEQRGSSPLVREIGVAAAPDDGAANATARRAAAGLALACPAQPTAASPRPATPIVVRGRPALTTEIPAPATAGAAVVTLHHREESRCTAVRHQQRQGPTQEVQIPSGVTPIATKKRASKCTPEKLLIGGPGPVTVKGRRGGAGGFVGITMEPTPQKWCPLHETSLHYVSACRHIGHLVEIRRERLAKHAAEGVTHSYHECG